MSKPAIHVFNHQAMAALFQARIAGGDATYAKQAARTAFDCVDRLEALLSRFRENSEISQIAALQPGESLRLNEPTFACLAIAQEMEMATRGAFSASSAAMRTQETPPRWSLSKADFSIRCEQGRLEFDLGAIGKGFALDRMAEELADWDCGAYLLVAGGSSILAGAPPEGEPGWNCGLGDDTAPLRYLLSNVSLSGSGLAVKGEHILDPRTGAPVKQRPRAWAMASTAAVSDALSTACMVLEEKEIAEIATQRDDWLVFLNDGKKWRTHGRRGLPVQAVST
jgi:thiamine biosynthesis lipoprotein